MICPSPIRVARRHVAGLFEPPPRVLKAVTEWALGVYAGHVLAYVERVIDQPPDDSEKRLAQIQRLLKPGVLRTKIEKIKTSIRIPIGDGFDLGIKVNTDMGFIDPHYQIVVFRKKERSKFLNYPDEESSKYEEDWSKYDEDYEDFHNSLRSIESTIETAEEHLRQGLANYKPTQLKRIRDRFDPKRLVELELLRREAKKYTSKSKSYKTSARTILPIDLSGWKYLDGISTSEVEQKQAEGNFT